MSRIQNQRESKIVDTKALMRRIFLKSPFKYLTPQYADEKRAAS